ASVCASTSFTCSLLVGGRQPAAGSKHFCLLPTAYCLLHFVPCITLLINSSRFGNAHVAAFGTGARTTTGLTTTTSSVSWSLRFKLWKRRPGSGTFLMPGVADWLVDVFADIRPPISRAWPSSRRELVRSARVWNAVVGTAVPVVWRIESVRTESGVTTSGCT